MDDGDTITLSFMAVDLLSEGLGLNCRVFPFTVPSVGATLEDRVTLAKSVIDDLREQRLVRGDEIDVRVADALRLLSNAKISIAVAGVQDGDPVLARVCASGRHAVVALQSGKALQFEFVRPTGLARAAVRLLPRMGPGTGQSVTIAERPDGENAWEPGGFVQRNRASLTGEHAQRGIVNAILQRPRDATGNFTVTGRDRRGRDVQAGDVSWFDTDVGRYLSQRKRGTDGNFYVTWSPADRTRLEHVLTELLDDVAERQS
jgi:hypothetical protein